MRTLSLILLLSLTSAGACATAGQPGAGVRDRTEIESHVSSSKGCLA